MSWDELLAAARALAAGPRRILGITGAPGAGKSVLARELVEALDGQAVLVGMDGFHLRNSELVRLGRLERKGAPDTFDAAGYCALLRRLRENSEDVYAPRFDRAAEEPVPEAVPVPARVPLVVTEGNYLLLREGTWAQVAPLLDECWYVAVDEDVRLRRLIARHMAYGRTEEQARERAYGSDLRNARLIEPTARFATRIVTAPEFDSDPLT